jgi:hypothetical protein
MTAASRGARGQRAPARGGGIFSRMSVAPMASMPPIRTAFVRGLAGTWSSPVVVGATIAWLLIEWLIVIALGYPGPFSLLADIAAPAPLSTNTDLLVSIGIFGLARGLPLVFITSGLVHALWHAIVVGLAVETIETGRASRWGAIRGLRAFPVSFAIHAFGVALFILSQIVAGIGGGSISQILPLVIFVFGVWVFAFAPVIAVTEGRGFRDCLGRSFRAARLPGSGNLTFAVIYVIPWYATFVAMLAGAAPGSGLGVNPPYTAWIYVLVVSLLHAAVIAAFAFRYLAIAEEVPDAPVRAAPARGASKPRGTRSGRR